MQENKKESSFEKLTPTYNVDLRVYEPAIDFAFKEKDINNIAITGAYGVGKSSVLEAYKKRHKEWKFLHVSMTNFEEEDKDKVVAKIEGNIINQLIHQISPNVIDQTKFRRKEKLCIEKVIRDLWSPFALILLLAIFIYSKYWYSDKAALDIETINTLFIRASSSGGTLILYTLIVFMMLLIICKVYILQVNKNILKRIKIQGNEIELFQRGNDEYFDRYLNEIIFMITYSEVDIFVFEDIDRFNDKAIIVFEKLREINRIVNIKKKVTKKIVFLYLVRDDLLTAAERTKFFDYIIPIVPILSGNNAYDKLIEFLSPDVDYKDFDRQFLRKSTFFIDDMRVLKSISNEFKVYYKMMDIKVNINKMMAIIMYKNLFPHDFSELRKRNGYIYDLFVNRKNTETTEILRLESILEIAATEGGYNSAEGQNELEECKRKINFLNTEPIYKKVTREEQNELFNFSKQNDMDEYIEIKNSLYFDLIKYLILNGYIDEYYYDYITIFYGNSITVNDKNFIISVCNREKLEVDYELNNPERVIEELTEYDFTQEETKNLNLFEYLLEEQYRDSFLKNLTLQLMESKDYRFINLLINRGKHSTELARTLINFWPNILAESIQNLHSNKQDEKNIISAENTRRLSMLFLYNCNTQEYAVSFNEHIRYISEHEKYISSNDMYIKDIFIKLVKLGVKIDNLVNYADDSLILDLIYNNNLYTLKFGNIKIILKKIYEINNEYDIKHLNYTLVMENNESPLSKYINSDFNINEYVDGILENCDGKIRDMEKYIIYILNNASLTYNRKTIYIEALKRKTISEIKEVEDISLWDLLLKKGCIKDNYQNALDYFSEKLTLTDELVDYINESYSVICLSGTNYKYESEFIESLIYRNEINDYIYEEILEDCNYSMDDFTESDYCNIDENKIYILIEVGIVKITENNRWICERLLRSDNIEVRDKIELLIKIIVEQDEDVICSMLDILGLNVFKKLFNNRARPKLLANQINKIILDAFVKRGTIAYYEVDNKHYKIYRTKPRQIK